MGFIAFIRFIGFIVVLSTETISKRIWAGD